MRIIHQPTSQVTFRRTTRAKVSVFLVALLAMVLVVAPTAGASASTGTFTVQWTKIGIYPRTTPELVATNKTGAALPDGTVINVVCETTGTTVTSDAGTSDIWERLDTGAYIPNVFTDTGFDGFTPNIPRCDQGEQASGEQRWPISADLYVGNSDVAKTLLDHYFDASGKSVEVDFAFFAADTRLMTWARQLPADSIGQQYIATAADDGDVYWASGAFSVARTSEHCWSIKDNYDFAPDKPSNWPLIGNWANQFFGNAKEFTVRSSGCIF